MGRLVATVQLGDVRGALREHTLKQYIETHPERDLLAFVQVETANWLQRVVPEESDKFVVMAALNLVDCIASVPLPPETKSMPCTQGQKGVLAPRRGELGRRS